MAPRLRLLSDSDSATSSSTSSTSSTDSSMLIKEFNKDELVKELIGLVRSDESIYVKQARYLYHCILEDPKHFRWSSAREEQIGNNLLNLVEELIRLNEKNFVTMLKKVKLTPANSCETFKGIADEVLMKDETGITWIRIGILYAFSTSMAKHCMPKAQDGFIDNFSNAVGKHIEYRTSSWVEKQGGWEAMRIEKGVSLSDYVISAVEVAAAVLGAVFTVVGLGSSSSAFSSFLSR